MPTYNFRKETKLYVVRNNFRYSIDIYPDLSFSQTFNETTVPVKTLHAQKDMFAAATITRANPANFSFTIPILLEADLDIILELLTDYDPYNDEATLKTADLYIESNSEVYKLEKAVFESGTFLIQKESFISLSISGTARKLSKFPGNLPGILVARTPTLSYNMVNVMNVEVADIVQNYITAVTVELKNDISWMSSATLQNSIGISEASETSFPEAFVVSGRTLSGTIQQYVTDDSNKNTHTWSLTDSIKIQVGNSSSAWALEFDIPQAVYTNRPELQDLLIQSYDFRMTSNEDLEDIIKKRSL